MSSSRPRPYTLYTPTHPQLAALSALLLAEPGSPGPQVLPIEPSTQNYPRWHPCDAFNWGHIFRDRFERKMRLVVDYESCVMKAIDRPQGQDEMLLSTYDCTVEGYASERVLDEEWAAAARERLKTVTPSARFGTRDGPAKGYC